MKKEMSYVWLLSKEMSYVCFSLIIWCEMKRDKSQKTWILHIYFFFYLVWQHVINRTNYVHHLTWW